MNRKVLYQIGIGLGAVFSFANTLFNKDHIQWLEYSGPVIIYISFFLFYNNFNSPYIKNMSSYSRRLKK